MKKSSFKVYSERVDDIPLIVQMAKNLKIDQIIDRHMPTHGHQKGLSNGTLTLGWLAYLLSEADHCKVGVSEWAAKLEYTLSGLLCKKVRPSDFNDDQLGRLLRRFSKDRLWEAVEKTLWAATLEVYDFSLEGVRLDSTSSYGYHEIKEDGVMQLGHSKDHRPDLPQLKIMAAVAEGCGHLIGSDVIPGNRADDILYTPLIQRIRDILGRGKALLYTGDCKMAGLSTRADVAIHKDYYFVPLPQIEPHGPNLERWAAEVTEGTQAVQLVNDGKKIVAGGYEFSRELAYENAIWNERVLVVKSFSYASQQMEALQGHLKTAEEKLRLLTPPVGRGVRQISNAKTLNIRIDQILGKHDLRGLLHVEFHRTQKKIRRYKGRGRGSATREAVETSKIRYSITAVKRNENQIARRIRSLGWRAFVTNAPEERLSFSQGVLHYRQGWTVERGFHVLKGRPLGIRPLFVKKEDQLIGLTRFLTLGLRMMTFMEMVVRNGLRKKNRGLLGLYKGQPKRLVKNPTAQQMLEAISRYQITLTKVELGSKVRWDMSEFPQNLGDILTTLKTPKSVYEARYYAAAVST